MDQFTVKICERGNRVELEDSTNNFKAILLEEDAKPVYKKFIFRKVY